MQIENFINYEKINDKLYIDNIKKNNLEEKIRQESERKKKSK